MNARLSVISIRKGACLLLAGLACLLGCDPPEKLASRKTPGKESRKVEPAEAWSPEKIAANPEGFCAWADQQLKEQLALLQGNRSKLTTKLEQLAARKKAFIDNVEEIRNLNKRAQTALRRADDEERWPAVVFGQSFDREKLESLISVTQKYVDQRTPLAEDYARGAQRLNLEIRKIDEQLAEVKRQQEVVAIDLERIKLSSELDRLPQLDSSKLNITAITSSLGRPSEEDEISQKIDELTTTNSPALTLDSFLKKGN